MRGTICRALWTVHRENLSEGMGCMGRAVKGERKGERERERESDGRLLK